MRTSTPELDPKRCGRRCGRIVMMTYRPTVAAQRVAWPARINLSVHGRRGSQCMPSSDPPHAQRDAHAIETRECQTAESGPQSQHLLKVPFESECARHPGAPQAELIRLTQHVRERGRVPHDQRRPFAGRSGRHLTVVPKAHSELPLRESPTADPLKRRRDLLSHRDLRSHPPQPVAAVPRYRLRHASTSASQVFT
jgi:hypothetical protein